MRKLRISAGLAVLVIAGVGLEAAVGQPAANAPAGGEPPKVETGAGTTTETTQGSSGPQPEPGDPPPPPIPVEMPFPPAGAGLLGLPGMLPSYEDPPKRCETISDANARQHCENGPNPGELPPEAPTQGAPGSEEPAPAGSGQPAPTGTDEAAPLAPPASAPPTDTE